MRLTAFFFLLLGLGILPFAFIASIWSSIGVLGSENHRIIAVLEGNPQQGYLAIIRRVALNGILPIAASIVLLIIALLKNPTMRFRTCLPLIVGGIAFIWWGISYIQHSYVYYFDTLCLAHNWPIENVDSYISSIYVACGFVGGLWLLAGILLSVLYPLRTLYRSSVGQPAGTSPTGFSNR